MNRINIAATGYPGTNKSWRFLHNAFAEPLKALAKLCGDKVILYGCQVSGGTVSDGWLALDGELYYFEGGNASQTRVLIKEVIEQAAYNTDADGDGFFDNLNTYFTRTAQLGNSGGYCAFSELRRLKSIKELSSFTLPDNIVIDPNYVHTDNNFTDAAKTKLEGIEEGAEKNVQADWNETNNGLDAFIKNKPSLQSDWNESNVNADAYIRNKPTLPGNATTSQRGIVELATYQEVQAGNDNQRAVTPYGLRLAGFKQIRVTRGTVTTANRAGGHLYNDYSKNRAYVYPPFGYSMSNLVGFIASIAEIHLAGDVDGNDSFWCKYRTESSRVTVIAQNSENRAASKIQYLAIWQK